MSKIMNEYTIQLCHTTVASQHPYFVCDIGYERVCLYPRLDFSADGVYVVCMDVSVEALMINDADRLPVFRAMEKYESLMTTFFQCIVFDQPDYPYPKTVFQEMLELDLTEEERSKVQQYLDGFTCLYLIKDLDTGLIKIGQSRSPERRLQQLIKQDTLLPTPNRFVLLRTWDDYPYSERVLHDQFAHQRQRGEWFALTDEDIKEALAYCNVYEEVCHGES